MTEHSTMKATLRDLLLILFFHKKMIVAIFVTIVGLTIAGCLLATPIYEARCEILIKPNKPDTSLLTLDQTTYTPVRPVTIEDLNSEIQILLSPDLLEKTVKELNLDQRPESSWISSILTKSFRKILVWLHLHSEINPLDAAMKSLGKNLNAEAITLSNIIVVKYQDPDPVLAAKIINSLCNLFIDQHLEVYQTPGTIEFFTKQAEMFKNQLEDTQEAFRQFKERYSLAHLETQREKLLGLSSDLQADLDQTRTHIVEIQAQIDFIKNVKVSDQKEELFGPRAIRENPIIAEIQKKITTLEATRNERLQYFKAENRKVTEIDQQILQMRQDLRSKIEAFLEADLAELQDRQSALNSGIEQHQESLQELNNLDIKKQKLERAIEIQNNNYTLYVSKLEEARISRAMDQDRLANVSIASKAAIPVDPVFPKKTLIIILSVLLALAACLGAAYTAEYLDQSFKTPEDVEACLQLPVLASIPDTSQQNSSAKP